jgi:type VI secretion system protein
MGGATLRDGAHTMPPIAPRPGRGDAPAPRGLLSRIARDGALLPEVESILAHVRALLNARRGEAPCAPGLGVADFADVVHAFPGGVDHLAKSIRATLLEFEPRLKAVSVRPLPSEGQLTLRFEIAAQLTAPGGRALRMTTTVFPGGRVAVDA